MISQHSQGSELYTPLVRMSQQKNPQFPPQASSWGVGFRKSPTTPLAKSHHFMGQKSYLILYNCLQKTAVFTRTSSWGWDYANPPNISPNSRLVQFDPSPNVSRASSWSPFGKSVEHHEYKSFAPFRSTLIDHL